MALPVITVLVCALFLELFSLLGYNLIGEKRLGSLRQECMQVKKEMDSTSAMDEFAKWAKLRRRFDKLVAELDSSKVDILGTPSLHVDFSDLSDSFVLYGTMFYVPRSWTGPFGYMLSLPFAPHAAISLQY
ncbi:hypothetical protein BC829DRAFT_448662 [Chytridium lagenaria]|nr:hypothetical protein BC829DRAFT_448662 [Chytridium lagenaria]